MISNPSSKDTSSERSKVALQLASAAPRSGDRVKAQMLLRDRIAEDPLDANAMSVLAQIAVDDLSDSLVIDASTASTRCLCRCSTTNPGQYIPDPARARS